MYVCVCTPVKCVSPRCVAAIGRNEEKGERTREGDRQTCLNTQCCYDNYRASCCCAYVSALLCTHEGASSQYCDIRYSDTSSSGTVTLPFRMRRAFESRLPDNSRVLDFRNPRGRVFREFSVQEENERACFRSACVSRAPSFPFFLSAIKTRRRRDGQTGRK